MYYQFIIKGILFNHLRQWDYKKIMKLMINYFYNMVNRSSFMLMMFLKRILYLLKYFHLYLNSN